MGADHRRADHVGTYCRLSRAPRPGVDWCGEWCHYLEKPLILVSVFKFIAADFDHKLSSTVYLLVLFVASIATAIYSPLAGYIWCRLASPTPI